MALDPRDIDLEYCKAAQEGLMAAFSWENSGEGYEYWSEVHRKLEEYADKAARVQKTAKKPDSKKADAGELEATYLDIQIESADGKAI
jgi:hypothetical protein